MLHQIHTNYEFVKNVFSFCKKKTFFCYSEWRYITHQHRTWPTEEVVIVLGLKAICSKNTGKKTLLTHKMAEKLYIYSHCRYITCAMIFIKLLCMLVSSALLCALAFSPWFSEQRHTPTQTNSQNCMLRKKKVQSQRQGSAPETRTRAEPHVTLKSPKSNESIMNWSMPTPNHLKASKFFLYTHPWIWQQWHGC